MDYQEIYKIDELIINYRCRGYCKLPYPGHPHGCPNYGEHDECPPNVRYVDELFDLEQPLWFIVEKFDLKSHCDKMKQAHPTWSARQCANLLYWQGGVRHRLLMKTLKFIALQGNINKTPRYQGDTKGTLRYTLLPEAMGVMVIDTCLALKLPIERQPVNFVHKIALVGVSLI